MLTYTREYRARWPYATPGDFRGLGLVLEPPEAVWSVGSAKYRPGDDWMYPGTPLGAIPTDDELARVYGYTPVHSGWVNGRPAGLGDAIAQTSEAVNELSKHQRRMFWLSVVATTAAAVTAAVAVVSLTRRRRSER